jgi:hypothetical protein
MNTLKTYLEHKKAKSEKISKTYQAQASEIKDLAALLVEQAEAFAAQDNSSPYFCDLLTIIEELKELNKRLK